MTPGMKKALSLLLILTASVFIVVTLKTVFIPLFVAFFIAYAFEPIIRKMSVKTGRTAAVILVMCIMLVATVLLMTLLIPMIQNIILTFTIAIPTLMQKAGTVFAPFLEKIGFHLPGTLDQLALAAANKVRDLKSEDIQTAGSVVIWAFSGTVGILSAAIIAVLIPFFSYYVMMSYSEIINTFKGLIPPRMSDKAMSISREMDDVLSHYIRGQATVCCVMGLLYAITLSSFGVQKGFGIGILTGLMNFIPYVGLFTGLILSLSFSLLNFQGWLPVLGCCLTFTVLPMFDNFFVTPKILGKSVGLNPVLIVVALLVGGSLLGILGLLVAVPASALIKVLLREGLEYYHTSDLYTGKGP